MRGKQPHPALTFARQQGHSTYFTGLPCARGHVAGRFTKGHVCIECKRQDRDKLVWNPARLAAKVAGERFYTAGRSCERGHEPIRYVSIDQCRACQAMHGEERKRKHRRQKRERYAADPVYREREKLASVERYDTLKVVRAPKKVQAKARMLAFLTDPRRSTEQKARYAARLLNLGGLTFEVLHWDQDVDHAIADALEAAGRMA